MTRPLVFVAMPFGRKRDATGTYEIDFDQVYHRGIRPAISRFDVECIRADEERSGGVIHLPMFERLLLAEIAIVDVTINNPNVFYELGVRHSARPYSTIIVSANQAWLPFDINLIRAVGYRLSEGALTDGAAAELVDALAKRIEFALSEEEVKDSPLFQLIPSFPGITLDHAVTESFRDRAREVDSIRERLLAARRLEDKDAALQSIRGIAAEIGPVTAATAESAVDVILSYRDIATKTAYSAMIALIDHIPRHLYESIRTLREQHAFALNRRNDPGDRDRAVEILDDAVARGGPTPETCGIAGRVFKDRYFEEKGRGGDGSLKAAGYLDCAVDWYRRGFRADPRDYYPGIDLATLLAIQNSDESLTELREVLPAVSFALARLGGLDSNDYWQVASVLEVAVLGNDWKMADRALRRALALGAYPWMTQTTANNLRILRDASSAAIDNARIEEAIAVLDAG
jgi:hypothetical protein